MYLSRKRWCSDHLHFICVYLAIAVIKSNRQVFPRSVGGRRVIKRSLLIDSVILTFTTDIVALIMDTRWKITAGRLFASFYLIRRLTMIFTRRSRDRLKLLFVIIVLNQSITLLLHALTLVFLPWIRRKKLHAYKYHYKPVSYLTKIVYVTF